MSNVFIFINNVQTIGTLAPTKKLGVSGQSNLSHPLNPQTSHPNRKLVLPSTFQTNKPSKKPFYETLNEPHMNSQRNTPTPIFYIYSNTPHMTTAQKMEKIRPKNHKNQMPRSKADLMRCKKHPKHRQSPGVCSVCLREKLSQLSSNMRKNTVSMASSCSSSSLSSLSSSNASSLSSPVHRTGFVGVEAKGRSVSFLKSTGKSVLLTKSRSMAFDVPMRAREHVDHGKKKSGFWSRLIGTRSTKRVDDGLVHSRTMRERATSRIH